MATSDKYDRQLRLWGAEGQKALMNSHILLINADATGTECLKNLVLPGLGHFTIIDEAIVRDQDACTNFFTPAAAIGRSRAEVAAEYLCEMNPDVNGLFKTSTVEKELELDPNYLKTFFLVVLSNPTLPQCHLVSSKCWDLSIPLIVVRSYGFIGTYRFQTREEHNIIEARPDGDLPDLRLHAPFRELEEFCHGFDLSSQDSVEHSHTPYVVILIQASCKWKSEHGGTMPRSYAEKKEFKALVESMRRPGAIEELNYTEAVAHAHRVFSESAIPDNVQMLLADTPENLSTNATDFRVLLHALRTFIRVHGEGHLCPLKGSIPDMTSTNENFVALQKIYMQKGEEDRVSFSRIVGDSLESIHRPRNSISMDVIDLFCKNIFNLQAVVTSAVKDAFYTPNRNSVQEALLDAYDDPLQTPLLFLMALEAADEFYITNCRYPGQLVTNDDSSDSVQLETDSRELWEILVRVAQRYGAPFCQDMNPEEPADTRAILTPAHAQEIARYGAAELHNISSFMGGLASQEAIKILTHMYVPLNNTFVFNGIAGCGGCYEL